MADDDGDMLDSWEAQADSGELDKRLEDMVIGLQNKEKQGISTGAMVVSDESGRTQYQPQVRILRREVQSSPTPPPLQGPSPRPGQATSSSSKHSKSLQQREVEYAEARLRIFGSLPPCDDDEDGVEEGRAEGNSSVTERDDNSIDRHSSRLIIQSDPSASQVMILRQPKGPDGTSGFSKQELT